MKFKKRLKQLKSFNPLSNKVEVANDTTIKWKVKNPHKKKVKLTVEINQKYEDVEFYAVVNGKPFLIEEQGINTDFNEDASNVFSAKIGMRKKF